MSISTTQNETFSGLYNLTPSNLFNKLSRQYPKAVNCFFNWLDEYKAKTNWNKQSGFLKDSQQLTPFPNFYDIPFEMQMGIIVHFFRDITEEDIYPNLLNYLPINELIDYFEKYITIAFHRLESLMTRNGKKEV
jgi:hypothetical protein